MRPFQIIFNPTSAAELAKMPKELQLHILGEFRGARLELVRRTEGLDAATLTSQADVLFSRVQYPAHADA